MTTIDATAGAGTLPDERRSAAARERAVERIERVSALPLLVAAVVSLPVSVVAGTTDAAWADAVDRVLWVLFAVEFATRLAITPRRARFLRRNWLDIVVVVVPPLRFARVARMRTALDQAGLHGASRWLDERTVGLRAVLARYHLDDELGFVLCFAVAAGFAVSRLERGADGPIDGFWDGVWWAVVTMATVGYGDEFPVTAAGRVVGVGTIVVGITFFALITGQIASWYVDRESRAQAPSDDLATRLAEVEARLAGAEERAMDARLSTGPTGDVDERRLAEVLTDILDRLDRIEAVVAPRPRTALRSRVGGLPGLGRIRRTRD